MPPSQPKDKKAAPASGKSPFVGRELFLAFAPGNDALPNEVEVRCLGQMDGFLHVVTPQGKASWINLDHVASVIVVDDEHAIPDAGDDAVTASDFPGLKSRYGSVEVKVADESDKAS